MLTYNQALEKILNTVQILPAIDCSLDAATGLVLAEQVTSLWDLPSVDNSAMDGFAFAWDSQSVGDSISVNSTVYAGDCGLEPAGNNVAARIMTGAPLPPDCDTVVPIEDVVDRGKSIRLNKTVVAGQHVRRQGEEVVCGEPIAEEGSLLQAGDIGLLAAAGVERVRVYPRPKVAILSTGNELVNLGTPLKPGQIVNSNVYLLMARLKELGCDAVSLGAAKDDRESLVEHIQSGLKADLLMTTGGVSIGDRDHVQEVLDQHGFKLGFWKVAIKPGKPVLFGHIGTMPVFGLPGNPAAAAATFELFVRPALSRLAGQSSPLHPVIKAELTADVRDAGKRQAFLWGELSEKSGRYYFTPSQHQGSNRNRSVQSASALLSVKAGIGKIASGTEVELQVLRLPGRHHIEMN